MRTYSLSWGAHRLALGPTTRIMGVLNVTPDSFSDGGRFFDLESAVEGALAMVAEGADIIDIGGESTRPFSEPVSEEAEIHRVVPVIEALSTRIDVPISIDTMKAAVAKRALEAGASIINDVSALRFDPAMVRLAADAGVPVILMHMLGLPKTMQVAPRYDDVVAEIHAFLQAEIRRAVNSGIQRSMLIVDPGIGFGKTLQHNLTLLANLDCFEDLDTPILVGTSRKRFLRSLLKPETQEDIPADSPVVVDGTQATIAAAVLNGAHLVRVHDVAPAKTTARIADAIRLARNGSAS